MTLRIIEISAPASASEKIQKLAEKYDAVDVWHNEAEKSWFAKKDAQRETTRILINVKNQQKLMDALTRSVQNNDDWRIMLIPVEATLPEVEEPEDKESKEQKKTSDKMTQREGSKSLYTKIKNRVIVWQKHFNPQELLKGSITREELAQDMDAGSRLNFDFMFLIVLSSVVAGIGLIQSDVAVIIGAMVIAPLLGPNLAISFAAALGNKQMLIRASITNAIALSFTVFLAILAGFFLPEASVTESTQLMNRTNINYASIALALSAGGAAVLSLTTGVASGLVGVMVAVALLPPAVALGFTIGNAQWPLAFGTGLLLATNIVCINLAGLAIFRLKGIRPRTWYEEKQANIAARNNAIIWVTVLIMLGGLIWVKNHYFPGDMSVTSNIEGQNPAAQKQEQVAPEKLDNQKTSADSP